MLQSIRDRLTGPLVWFVVGLIVIPFAFWGIESFRTDGGDPVIAEVGDQDITQSQFQAGYEQRYQQLQSLLGENFRPEMFEQERFRKSVLDDMVQESALRQYAREAGYRADDSTLVNYLSEILAFQKDGKFSSETYREVLARQGLSPQGFEAQLRDSLVIDQMRGAVLETAFVTEADVAEAYRLQNQSRGITVAQVSAASFRDGVTVSDAQVADRYESDKTRFMSPERLKVSYVELDPAKLPAAAEPDAEMLKVLYEAEKDARFSTTEERRARHILIGFGADKSAAKQKAEGISQQLKSGGDFAALAQEHSEDPGSKKEGGDLGWVRRGAMVPRFEEALFGMKAGEVVGPIETEFGWHLIRLEQVKSASIRPFDDAAVKAELLEAYRQREREKHAASLSEKLEQLAFEKTTLEPIATELNLPVQTTDWFTRAGGPGIAAVEALRQAAFAPEVLETGENSKPVSLGDGRVAVVHKAEYEPARQRSLDEVRAELREQLVAEGAKAGAAAAADKLLADARGGQTLQAAAPAHGANLIFEGEVRRNEVKLDPAVLQAAFRLPRPSGGKSSLQRVDLADGNVAVIAVNAVTDPSLSGANEAEVKSQAMQLRDALGGAAFGAYREAIEDEISVDVKDRPAAKAADSGDPGP